MNRFELAGKIILDGFGDNPFGVAVVLGSIAYFWIIRPIKKFKNKVDKRHEELKEEGNVKK